MQIILNDLSEFHDLAKAMGYARPGDLKVTGTIAHGPRGITVKAARHFATAADAITIELDLSETTEREAIRQQPEAEQVEGELNRPPASEESAIEPTKRKRRTKAEIEAERAAQAQAATTAVGDAPQAVTDTGDGATTVHPLDNLKPESPAHAEIAEMVALYDGNDKLAHLNEGRQFIEAHGFPAYNETMQLADVPPNIAAHTPEQVSRHRAAMAWLHAQKTKG